MQKKLSDNAALCVAASLAAVFVAIRLYKIDAVGIANVDPAAYVTAAVKWAHGDCSLHPWFRPGAYFLYSVVYRFFDNPLFSIKILNCVLDCGVFLMVAAVTWYLTRSRWWGVLCAFVYSGSHTILYNARSEGVHIPCAFFVFLSFVFMIAHGNLPRPRYRRFALVVSGLALSCATLIHESVGILGVASILAVGGTALFAGARSSRRQRAEVFLVDSALYSLAFFAPIAFAVWFVGVDRAMESMSVFLEKHHRVQDYALAGSGPAGQSFIETAWIANRVSIEKILFPGTAVFILFVAANAYWILCMARKKTRHEATVLLWAVAAWILFSASFYASGGFDPVGQYRIYLNILPVVVVFTMVLTYRLVREYCAWRPWTAQMCLLLVALPLVFGSAEFYAALSKGEYHSLYEADREQWAYDVLKERVDENNRLLIVPYIYRSCFMLTAEYCFSDNAVYLNYLPYSGMTLEDLIRTKHIGFIVWFDVSHKDYFLDPEYFRQYHKDPLDFYGFRKSAFDGYTVEREQSLYAGMLASGDLEVLARSDHGVIYEIDVAKLGPAGSFEAASQNRSD